MRNLKLSALALFLLFPRLALAQDYGGLITEDYLRSTFVFADTEQLKFSACEEKSFPTCTYVWGGPHRQDAARMAAGLSPDGAKLMTIFAQAPGPQAWPRVTGTYNDAEDVTGLGSVAVWSPKRNQLSLMTSSNLVIHVNLERVEDAQAKAIEIAEHLLGQL